MYLVIQEFNPLGHYVTITHSGARAPSEDLLTFHVYARYSLFKDRSGNHRASPDSPEHPSSEGDIQYTHIIFRNQAFFSSRFFFSMLVPGRVPNIIMLSIIVNRILAMATIYFSETTVGCLPAGL